MTVDKSELSPMKLHNNNTDNDENLEGQDSPTKNCFLLLENTSSDLLK
jgi:hypothetical protein